ncbi:MAG: YbaB/EbfC family nucleoid-associated protein [Candidatus Kapaibacterium sp.]|jgi:DNA-binding YbaB/EbfC family protein|nr:YbaB/EbfC family nucleoid-associated protein [Candidatus Kapabacteria bacterium]
MKFDMQAVLEQAKKMQDEVTRMKEELEKKTVTAESGGGLVSVELRGDYTISSLNIAPELITGQDKNMIEDLVVAAINLANEKMKELSKSEYYKVKGMMPNIPGMNF